MKRFLAVAAIVLAASLTACGTDNKDSDKPSKQTESSENGGVQILAKAGDQTSADITVSITLGTDENVCLLDTDFESIKHMDELETPEQFFAASGSDPDMTSMFDGTVLDEYWKNAKVINKADSESSETDE